MAHPVDIHVGRQLRNRRKLLGMTQQELGDCVGIRFQQIQKYESGANRVSASRLWELSRALGVPVEFFYQGLEPSNAVNDNTPFIDPAVMDNKETIDLLRAYYGLEEQPRQRLLELAKAIHRAAF